ncbi:hypothetical protein RNJ44_01972 [Nakaseomyces bracarensis]|uniref:Enoyl reductase (ER) domain-containing protein n=1 Tax=Nakaseomyces bracarensis TaxID=273131 RepID=A0ABR4NPB2_9SACH
MVLAKQWIMKTEPQPGHPFNFDKNSDDATFELIEKELKEEDLAEGEVLVETEYLSNDPAQKFWIASIDKNYAKGLSKGEVVTARGIGKVLASKDPKIKVGDYVSGRTGWTTHCILKDTPGLELAVLDMTDVKDPSWYLSILGGTALTAYFIFYNYAELQERESDYNKTYLITGAAGAIGTISIQLALHAFKAKKVIAVAGGPDKVKFVESFGDRVVGVDYKDPNFKENLLKASGGPNTVDYFIDNVGGDLLDLGTILLKVRGYILACGSISGYNDPTKLVYKYYGAVVTKRLTIKGLLLMDNKEKFPEGYKKLKQMIKDGEIDISKAATIKDASGVNFVDVPDIWNGLFSGANKGKLISKVH